MNELAVFPEKLWWKRKLVDLFAIDPRSLAVFRIGIALVLLYDLIDRMFDLEAMVLDRGILSVKDAAAHANPSGWSLYFLSSADWFQTTLFGLTVLSCVLMMVGCFTRVATVATWILVVSLQARMPIILNGGDSWMRVMLFWAMFLPLGRVWSIDAKRAGRRFAGAVCDPVLSFATTAILVQVAAVYFFAGLAKWNDVWLNGEAMHYAFDQLIFYRPLGRHLLDYPVILRLLCYSTLALEIAAPLLLFVPFATRRIRIVLVLLVYAFHLGIELTMNIGHFSYIALASWTLFLPAVFWKLHLLARFLPRRQNRKSQTELTQTTVPQGLPIRIAKWTVNAFTACCLAVLLSWNLSWIAGEETGQGIRDATEPFAATIRLKQRWQMFGKPYSIDPWYVYRAQLEDGSIVDLIRNGDPPSDRRPTTPPPGFWNHRWKKMHHTVAMQVPTDLESAQRLNHYRHRIAEYLCRKWNREHGDEQQIVKLDVLCFGTEIGPGAASGEYSRATFATLTFAEPEEASAFQDEFLRLESGEDPFSAKF